MEKEKQSLPKQMQIKCKRPKTSKVIVDEKEGKEDDEGQSEHSSDEKPRQVIRRKRKKTRGFKNEVIVLNVIDTKYEVVRMVGRDMLGWQLSRESLGSANWDVYWTDNMVSGEMLGRMEPFQKVNHFPGSQALT
jgi:tubulin polyglutamylase TTLL6/13